MKTYLEFKSLLEDWSSQFKSHAKDLETNHPSATNRISSYKDKGYSINNKLRNDEELHPHEKEMVHHMDHVTSFKTKKKLTLYRGIQAHEAENYKPGSSHTDYGYTSTTVHHGLAHSYGMDVNDREPGEHPVHVMHIHAPAGTRAHHVDAHRSIDDHEGEVLLHRGTKFHVTHHEDTQDGPFRVRNIHARIEP